MKRAFLLFVLNALFCCVVHGLPFPIQLDPSKYLSIVSFNKLGIRVVNSFRAPTVDWIHVDECEQCVLVAVFKDEGRGNQTVRME